MRKKKQKLKSLPPGADAGVPRAAAAYRCAKATCSNPRPNPQPKTKDGWVA
jgi:hypothetical protein